MPPGRWRTRLMSPRTARNRAGRSLSHWLGAGLAAATVLLAGAASAAESVSVILDRATVLKMPEKVATVIVGNPLIADVSLQPGGIMVLTGKGYGITNVLALDRSGTVLMEKSLQVLPGARRRDRGLPGSRAGVVQLQSQLRTQDHARRRAGAFRGRARPDRDPDRAGAGQVIGPAAENADETSPAAVASSRMVSGSSPAAAGCFYSRQRFSNTCLVHEERVGC